MKLSEEDRLRLVMWIDANAPYHDRFVNKRADTAAYDLASDHELRKKLTTLHERRCATCHKVGDLARLDWIDLREPAHSLFLVGPLAKEAGGTEKCGRVVYASAADENYLAVRRLVEAAVNRAWEKPRRDVFSLERPAKK